MKERKNRYFFMGGLWFLWEIGSGDENESGRCGGGSGSGPLNEEMVVVAVDVRLENRERTGVKIRF